MILYVNLFSLLFSFPNLFLFNHIIKNDYTTALNLSKYNHNKSQI